MHPIIDSIKPTGLHDFGLNKLMLPKISIYLKLSSRIGIFSGNISISFYSF